MSAVFRPLLTALVLGNLATASLFAAPLTFHVNPHATAPGDGSESLPFPSLSDAARRLGERTPAELAVPAEIILHTGRYELSQPLRLGPAESGTADDPVSWAAAGDGSVEISGGQIIPDSAVRPVTDPVTLARLPAHPDSLVLCEIRLTDLGQTNFPELLPRGFGPAGKTVAWPELFQNGTPLPLSAWPNGTGYAGGFSVTNIIHPGHLEKANPAVPQHHDMVFQIAGDQAQRWGNAMRQFHASPWLGGHWFWDWADDFLPVAAIADDGTITVTRPAAYGLGKQASLHIYNLAEEMDAPGEYSLEPAQKCFLILLPKNETHHRLALSWLGQPLLLLDRATHLAFTGLRFANGRADGADLTACADIAFRRCLFADFGNNGLHVQGRRITVEDSLFENLGACGVNLDGGDVKTLTHAENRVAWCEFRNFGRLRRTYQPGVELNGVGSTAEHCLIHDAPHSAILYSGQEHLIRDNEICAVLQETGDCGAIYSGRDWTRVGNVIAGNWIHDLGGNPGRWPCGIYLDDQLSGITVTNNFIDHAALGLLVGGGRDNLVTGNIFAHCDEGMQLDSRGTGWAKPMQTTLRERLAKIPVAAEPWLSRYPGLQTILADRPEKPVGTRITGNALVACKKPWKAKTPSGVATVDPNWENLPANALEITGPQVAVTGTSLTFTKPAAGIRR